MKNKNTSRHTSRRQFLKTLGTGTLAAGAIAAFPKAALGSEINRTWTSAQDPRLLSLRGKKRVAIFGGGVGGLTAAQELLERGFDVTLYERRNIPGGKARSMDVPDSARQGRKNLPGEHGFRFFPGFYKHLPDTMAKIPFGGIGKKVSDNLIASDEIRFSKVGRNNLPLPAKKIIVSKFPFTDYSYEDLKKLATFASDRMGVDKSEVLHFFHRMYVFLTSCDARRLAEYEHIPWFDFIEANKHSEEYRKLLAVGATRILVAMRAEDTSTRTIGLVVTQLFMGLLGMSGNIDRVLNGPTNEVWINPWLSHLKSLGLKYNDDANLNGFDFASNGMISSAEIEMFGVTTEVKADFYVCATPIESFRDQIMAKNPNIQNIDPDLAKLKNLTSQWMTGIQFYFDRDIEMSLGHTMYLDSPWALTSISQKKFWSNIDLANYGDGNCEGILSVDISDWEAPGILYKRPATKCTKEEIKNEVWAQLYASWDQDIRTQIKTARLLAWHLDPGIHFGSDGIPIHNEDPLLINPVGSLASRPNAWTKIPNLMLASDYVRTNTDLASMEAANEAARMATNRISDISGDSSARAQIWNYKEPSIFAFAKFRDQFRFKNGKKNAHEDLDFSRYIPKRT